MPSGKATGARVSASMKGRITETRMAVLFFRIFQLLGAIGALTTMVLITGVDTQMGWIMRIVVRNYQQSVFVQMLITYFSLVYLFCIHHTAFTTCPANLPVEHQAHLPHTCCLPACAMLRLWRFTPFAQLRHTIDGIQRTVSGNQQTQSQPGRLGQYLRKAALMS